MGPAAFGELGYTEILELAEAGTEGAYEFGDAPACCVEGVTGRVVFLGVNGECEESVGFSLTGEVCELTDFSEGAVGAGPLVAG